MADNINPLLRALHGVTLPDDIKMITGYLYSMALIVPTEKSADTSEETLDPPCAMFHSTSDPIHDSCRKSSSDLEELVGASLQNVGQTSKEMSLRYPELDVELLKVCNVFKSDEKICRFSFIYTLINFLLFISLNLGLV